ncbi:MAG: V-type ATP synthase subunit D [Spirochaetales bacterium]|nr:V-type ATP synthase subunit D [Spirochaetales bacterium]
MNISPTKSNLLATKRSLIFAEEGYTLLNRKRNVLIREMMQLIDDAREVQESIETVFKQAYDGLQKANLSIGIEYVEELGFSVSENDDLSFRLRSVMGVEVPSVDEIDENIEPAYGFFRTNSNLDQAYKAFKRALSLIAHLSEIETSVYKLAMEIKKTQRRVHALEKVLIPQYKSLVKFIESYIEETERDDFFRMKMLKQRR